MSGSTRAISPAGISIQAQGETLTVVRADDSKESRSRHGLVRANLANIIKGVTDGWVRELEINGVGYRAEVAGDTLTMALGFSHPVVFKLPKGVSAKVEKNKIALSSADRDVLGQTAAKVREIRPPEPYKGKGIKYAEEVIKKKSSDLHIQVGLPPMLRVDGSLMPVAGAETLIVNGCVERYDPIRDWSANPR